MRKASHEALNKVVAHGLNNYQMVEALALAKSGLHDSATWDGHLRRTSASLMLSTLYGERPVSVQQSHIFGHASSVIA